jgi:hypothetical protein
MGAESHVDMVQASNAKPGSSEWLARRSHRTNETSRTAAVSRGRVTGALHQTPALAAWLEP